MIPIATLIQLLAPLLAGAAGRTSPSEEPNKATAVDPAVLAALITASQKPAEPLPAPKLPAWIGALGIIIAVSFAGLLSAIIWMHINGHSEKIGELQYALGLLSALLVMVAMFAFGSSWGSRTKDARPPAEPAGAPIILPPTVSLPPAPIEPAPPVEPSEPTADGIGRSTDPSTAAKRTDLLVSSVPASIRYNNPGAQYPSERAAAFGQLGYGIIGGGHKIALFPHPVNGAAANFDLLYRNYTGMTIGAAGDKWTGGNGFGVPGYDPNAILAKESLDKPEVAIAIMKAVARREAGRESPITAAQWLRAYAMFRSGSADVYLDGPQSVQPDHKQDMADAIVAAMRRKNYVLDTKPGEVNIVYVEGMNEDGTVNDDRPDIWNDLRVVIGFDGDRATILGKWQATTEPGVYYTDNPVNPGGAARIEFGQYTAWRVGMHRGDHEALVQRGMVTVARDLNKDMIRTSDARDTGEFGINQHGPSGVEEAPATVGKFSAGCLVGKTMAGHKAFLSIVKSDPRFVEDPEYMFRTAILAEKDVTQ